MKILKQWLSKEEFERFIAGTWTPDSHTHTRSEITDFWATTFWGNIPDKPSTFTPSAHAFVGAKHTASGLTVGHVVKATGATTFAWGQLPHDKLGGLADDDHTQYHNDTRGDARYYTQGQVDTKLALQDTLAEMGDTLIVSPEDGELLVWDAESPPSGKWICSTQLPSHNHDDLYYTETELDAGQLDNRYFRENEFLVTSAGVGDSGKPIKLNAAGLVDPTMLGCGGEDELAKVGGAGTPDYLSSSYFERTVGGHVMIKQTTKLVDVNVCMLDGKHDTDFSLATHGHSLAGLSDTLITSLQDNEILMYDAEVSGGKWINVSGYPHSHDDLYYTETELDAGQLDNQYYTETELDGGQLDTRYYTETEINGFFEGYDGGKAQVHWDRVTNKPSTYPPSSHNHDDLYYTEGEVDTKLALQDTLAEMNDCLIVSPEDGEILVWDADSPPSGKWICSTQIPSHNHDDLYYTETELDAGQLDNRYFRENEFLVTSGGVGDSGKPIKLNAAGQVDATMIPGGGQDELVKVGAAGGSDYLNPNYFQRDVVDHVRIKLNTLLTGVDVDKLDGLHAASFALTTRALDTFGATTDITTLNATTVKHGLLMKLGGGTTNYLRADGAWVAPPGGVTDHGALSGLGDDDHSQYLLASGARALSADWDAGYFEIRSMKFQSDVATGTAPFIINSTTKCINLNVDRVDGEHASAIVTKTRIDAQAADHGALSGRGDDDHSQYYNNTRHTVAVHNALSIDHGSLSGRTHDDHSQYLLASGARALSANWDAGGYQIRALKFLSDVATGTIPLAVSSTTKCTNLNTDLLDGYHASQAAGNNTVVVRSAAGYIFCNYLNCTSGETSSNPTHYIVETGNDSYLRQMTPAIFISNLRADGLMGVIGGGFTGMVTVPDHMGTPATAQVTNCCYGTGSPPTASTTPIGTLFIRYTA